MRIARIWSWPDLRVVVGLALVGVVVSFLPLAGWLQAAVLAPLVLALPGFAITAALFPEESVPLEEWLVYTIAFSVGASGLGGLALQLVVGLDQTAWALLLAAVTVSAATAASARREALPINAKVATLRLPSVGLASTAAVLAAAAIAGWSIAIANGGAERKLEDPRVTSLWVLPSGLTSEVDFAADRSVTVGVSNHGSRSRAYLLVVRRGADEVRRWRFRLDADQDWKASLDASAIAGSGPLVASLFRGGRVFRQVALDTGGRT